MSSTIKVLHLSTHNEECGIAIFQQNIVDAMGEQHEIENTFFDISPNKLKVMKGRELDVAIKQLLSQLKDFDILHIQHEYSFYNNDQLQRVVDGARARGKKILFTLHTPPHALKEHWLSASIGLNPRSWVHARRIRIARKRFFMSHIRPLFKADMLVVLGQSSRDSFASYGLSKERMRIIELPIPKVNTTMKTTEISQQLHKKAGDTILSTFGFVAKPKGNVAAIKALSFLPPSYKLAIVGGTHPSGQNDKFYDQVCDIIAELGLQDRVYITGYVEDADKLDALLRETDICLYPYDKHYYDYVSSAALTNAIANYLPIVAYRTRTFEEANQAVPFMNFCHSPNYYELARVVQTVDTKQSSEQTKQYAKLFTIEKQAKLFAECYQDLTSRK